MMLSIMFFPNANKREECTPNALLYDDYSNSFEAAAKAIKTMEQIVKNDALELAKTNEEDPYTPSKEI